MKIIFFTTLLFYLMSASVSFGQIDPKVVETGLYKSTTSDKAKKFYNLAEVNFQNRNYEKAIEQYKLAILEDSNYIEAYDNLGLAFRKTNALDSAEFYYLLSHKKYPKGGTALQNLAIVEQIRGNVPKAIGYYEQLIEIDPKDPEGYYGISILQVNSGKLEDGLKNAHLAEQYYKEVNSPYIGDCYYLLFSIYYHIKDKPSAKKYLDLSKKAGVKIDPKIEAEMQ